MVFYSYSYISLNEKVTLQNSVTNLLTFQCKHLNMLVILSQAVRNLPKLFLYGSIRKGCIDHSDIHPDLVSYQIYCLTSIFDFLPYLIFYHVMCFTLIKHGSAMVEERHKEESSFTPLIVWLMGEGSCRL